ncbi:Ribosome biogenesis protein Nop10 [uncultured archaeon]|nr:Ribosome biogenesis protein Nop10 [uncultured archaeon]
MKWMKKCPAGAHYTLSDICPLHHAPSSNPHPPKFNPKDKNGEMRRKEKGLVE